MGQCILSWINKKCWPIVSHVIGTLHNTLLPYYEKVPVIASIYKENEKVTLFSQDLREGILPRVEEDLGVTLLLEISKSRIQHYKTYETNIVFIKSI